MGYLMVDDRNSGGELREYDTVSCKHCQAIIKIVKRQKSGYWCHSCGGFICEHCGKTSNGECLPFKKKLDEKLRRQAMFKSMGLGG